MCYCEGIEYFISDVFRVSHFADGPLGLVSQTPAHLDQCILHGAEESLFWGKHTCSLFTTSLRIKRGVICVVKTFCSRVIDPEKSNLWISCQLYRTVQCEEWPSLGCGPGLLMACCVLMLEGSRNLIWKKTLLERHNSF